MNPDHQTTASRSWQAAITVMLVCVIGTTGTTRAAEVARGPYAEQLARECDELIELAVKRPYGWGWCERVDSYPQNRRPEVRITPPGTPGAGLVLLWAGSLLNEPRYTDAAVNVARGVVVSVSSNGMILSHPTFAGSVGGRDVPALVPDRAATRAGLALLLACIGADPQRDEMFRRAAFRASIWLTRQQSQDGGWPHATPTDLRGAVPSLPARVIRLDSPDFRDSTFALLLAASVMNDRPAARGAASAVEKLMSLQLGGPGKIAGLWSSFYRLDGTTEDRIPGWPIGADTRASKWSLETLLAASLLAENQDAGHAARDAARSLRALRGEDGLWRTVFPIGGWSDEAPAAGDTIFEPATQPASDAGQRARFGVDGLLDSVEKLQVMGPAAFGATLSQSATIQERLANAICGLEDDPLAADWPQRPQDVQAYLIAHEANWRILEGPPPDRLDDRAKRLYMLVLRCRLEQQFGEMR